MILTEGVSVVQKPPRLHPLSISQDHSQEDEGATCLTPARSVPDMETKSKSRHLPYQKLDSLTQKYPRQFSSQTASFASDGSQVGIFKLHFISSLGAQSFTSLMADFRQDITRVSSFSKLAGALMEHFLEEIASLSQMKKVTNKKSSLLS